MEWTNKTPAKPGMYWYRRKSKHHSEENKFIAKYVKDICKVFQVDIDCNSFGKGTEWSSEPIAEPNERR